MHNVAFENAFPVARELARHKALGAIGRCGLTHNDREDIEGQLLLHFYLCFPRFDEQRASVRTFASRVMDKELTSILRYRLAGRRRHLGEPALSEELGEHNGVAVISSAPPHTQRLQFWVDVERALALLPEPVRETAVALCWSSPSELSRTLGRSRTVIYARMRLLREAFLAAGIGPAYFASSGVRQ